MGSLKVSALVSNQWLRNQLRIKAPNLRLLDTTWALTKTGHDDYAKEHIPGALFYDLYRCVNPQAWLPRNIPNPSCFTEYAQSLGINKTSHLVFYDRGTMTSASRAWWNFRAYGHQHVSVLDGGLTRWKAEGLPTETGPMMLLDEVGDFEVVQRPELIKEFEDMIKAQHQSDTQIADARSARHFLGQEPEPVDATKVAYEGMDLAVPEKDRQSGHIPGAVNLQTNMLIDKETNCFLDKDKLIKVFRSVGIDLSQPLTTMCYNGNAACVLALAAAVCGQENASVYHGSWTEYGYRASPGDVTKGAQSGGIDGA